MSRSEQERREIRVLPDELASQIAAGEVVERPASVVKELVENAIDAGATRVSVEVSKGGKERIQVTDDGCGMTAQELRLALRRHATSKLRTAADLERIHTLGFRGEALPSVASVSRMTVVSRPAQAVEGVSCACTPGQAPALRATGCPAGTRVEVSELFFNVPARLKFLKTDRTESAHVQETLLQIGLAHPAVHLTLAEGGRTSLDLPRHRNLEERAAAALARRGAGALHAIHAQRDGYHLRGALGSPLAAVSGARNVYLLVNGRAVKDRLLLRMLASGYGALLPSGRYPVAVLHLQVPATEVDVNVHPQKQEVRFAEERTVAGFVRRAVSQGVTEAPWVSAAGVSVLDAQPAGRVYRLGQGGIGGHARHGSLGGASEGTVRMAEAAPSYGSSAEAPWPPAGSAGPPRGEAHVAAEPVDESQPLLPLPLGEPGSLRACRFIGHLLSTYLLLEDRDGLLLVDQHAAHERVTYSRFRAALQGGDAPMQRLLFPAQVSLSPSELATAEAHHAALVRYGFDLSPLGGDTVAVRAIPSLLPGADPARLLGDVLSELAETGESETVETSQDRVIATLACHASVRAGQALGAAEVAALLEALDRAERSGHCPHGRPVVIRLPEAEIRRRFHRE